MDSFTYTLSVSLTPTLKTVKPTQRHADTDTIATHFFVFLEKNTTLTCNSLYTGLRCKKNRYLPDLECSTAFSMKSTIVLLLNFVKLPKLKLPERENIYCYYSIATIVLQQKIMDFQSLSVQIAALYDAMRRQRSVFHSAHKTAHCCVITAAQGIPVTTVSDMSGGRLDLIL